MAGIEHAHQDAIAHLRKRFAERFGSTPIQGPLVFASAPGRVELAGNHTDHQGGRVISAAINLRTHALAAPNGAHTIRLFMEGFGTAELNLTEQDALLPRTDERGTSRALVRGMAARYVERGAALDGFDMVVTSRVPAGAGLSSSAAFEMLVGRALEALFPQRGKPLDAVSLALDGMHAERAFFGKPCGAQDQIASACGGAVAMNFAENPPAAHPIAFDAAALGHALCLVDSRCDHARFAEDFAAIPADMHAVASFFGCETLGAVRPTAFLQQLGAVRAQLGDKAALRALHYFDETQRAEEQQRALEQGDYARFLAHARLSGASSAQYLQNVSPSSSHTADGGQPAMVILALCSHLLGQRGAWRIHGGGFGGSVLAFVPEGEVSTFTERMNALLGYDACTTLRIDPHGAFAARLAN